MKNTQHKALKAFLVFDNTDGRLMPLCIIADDCFKHALEQANDEVAEVFDVDKKAISVVFIAEQMHGALLQENAEEPAQSIQSLLHNVTLPQRIHDFDFCNNSKDKSFLKSLGPLFLA